METSDAVDIIAQERLLLEQWLDQDAHPFGDDEMLIKDRDITRALRALTEAARYAPPRDAAIVARIVDLAETRLNSARPARAPLQAVWIA